MMEGGRDHVSKMTTTTDYIAPLPSTLVLLLLFLLPLNSIFFSSALFTPHSSFIFPSEKKNPGKYNNQMEWITTDYTRPSFSSSFFKS